MGLAFDHLVIGAADLEQGAEWAKQTFGAAPRQGGAHPGLGTHNLVARLQHGYLEIIAPDPSQGPPRWMGLHDPTLLAQLQERPRPIAWMMSSDAIETAAAAADWDLGALIEARRDDLSWRTYVPTGGRAVDSVLPTLIEWPARLGRRPPVQRMAPLGLPGREMALGALRLKHPEPERIEALLGSIGAAEAAARAGFELSVRQAGAPALEAAFRPVRFGRSV